MVLVNWQPHCAYWPVGKAGDLLCQVTNPKIKYSMSHSGLISVMTAGSRTTKQEPNADEGSRAEFSEVFFVLQIA